MSTPKIAIVNVFFPPQTLGGATRVVQDNVDELVRNRAAEFDLVFYTSDDGETPAHQVNVYTYNGRRVYRAGVVRRPNMDWHPFDPPSGEQFGRFLDHEKPNLVHFHCIQRLTASIVEETLKRGIPYVVTLHDAWWISDFQFLVDPAGTVYPDGHQDPFVELPLPEGVTREASMQRSTKLRSLLNSAARVLTVSESFAQLHRKNGFPQVEVTMNGVSNLDWLPRTHGPDGIVRMGHVGGMSAHKGYDLVREALLAGSYPHLALTVVDHSKAYGYRREETWGSSRVTFVGKYPQHLIPELYANLDVLLAPSTWPESFGLVTREAAAAGCWVVASDIGGIGEQVESGVNGFVVEAGSLASVAGAFTTLDADPDRFRRTPPFRVARSVGEQVTEVVAHWHDAMAHATTSEETLRA